MKNKLFIWSYNYLFYTLFKNAREQDFISDMPRIASICALTIWWSVISITIIELLTATCVVNNQIVVDFYRSNGGLNKYIDGIVFLVINFFYFSKDRIKKIEFKYDSLPARTRKIGNVISWIVLVIPMAAFLYVGLMITPCYMLG